MSSATKPEEVALRFYDAFDRRAIDELVSMLADDIHQAENGWDLPRSAHVCGRTTSSAGSRCEAARTKQPVIQEN